MEYFTIDSIEAKVLTGACICLIIQALYYLLLYNRIWRYQRAIQRGEIHFTAEQLPLSVILYAHQSADELRQNLPAILQQDYPQFEVIVIIDGNDDDSKDYLIQLEREYSHLYHSFIPDSSRYISRKKLAITLGIKASKYEWIVLTETNCQPQSKLWLQTLARNFTPHTDIVLGYAGYERGNGWLHKQMEYDCLWTAMRYMTSALIHCPYMGIGRNLAYRKSLFFKHKGLSAHLNLQRGDDDLFVNQTAHSGNTCIECAPLAIVRRAPASAKKWREEKIEYTSTARLYRGGQRWIWGGETTSRLVFYIGWITLIVMGFINQHWITGSIGLLLFIIRFGIQIVVVNQTAQTLQEPRRYYATLLFFDWIQPLQSLRWKLSYLFRKKSDFLRK